MSGAVSEATREGVRAKLAKAIGPSAGAMTDAHEISAEVESRMHRHFRNLRDYNAKARSLVFNLKQSTELRARVIGRVVTAEYLATCAVKDLAPSSLQMQRRESAERYLAQRSLGESQVQVVGWSAGTTGKLDWSHKFEKETLENAKAAEAAAGVIPIAVGLVQTDALDGDEDARTGDDKDTATYVPPAEAERGNTQTHTGGDAVTVSDGNYDMLDSSLDDALDATQAYKPTYRAHKRGTPEGSPKGYDRTQSADSDVYSPSSSTSPSAKRLREEEVPSESALEVVGFAPTPTSAKCVPLRERLEAPLLQLGLADAVRSSNVDLDASAEVNASKVIDALEKVRKIRSLATEL